MSTFRLLAGAVGLLSASLGMGCGDSTVTGTHFGKPTTINIVTGNNQSGTANQVLPDPLTLQVLDDAGQGVPGLTITWNVPPGNGVLFARHIPTVTDSLGLVFVLWQLGGSYGPQGVSATCCQLPGVAFSARSLIPPAQRIQWLSGIGQQDTVRGTLAYPIVIRVLRPDGTFDVGTHVAFRAISRGSSYAPADTQTDAQGTAQTVWTLGTVAGVESTAVLVPGLPPAVIVAVAQPGAAVRIAIAPRRFPVLGVIGDTVWAGANAWDRYDNVINRTPVIRVVDTTIADTSGGYGANNAVRARHHGSTFVTAQMDAVRDSAPLTVLGFSGVSVGGGHICGASLAGDAYCWGENYEGSVGDGTRTDRVRPVLIGAGLGLQVPYTDWHTCALNASSHAYCWGLNQDGELGDGSAKLRDTVPVPVVGGNVFSEIRSGRSHTCAVATNGDAYCWGGNFSAQLGRDTLTSTCYSAYNRCSSWPILVTGGLQFAHVSAGLWQHSCGVTTSGAAYCWGLNASGQLGNDTTTDMCGLNPPAPCSYTPRLVEGGIVFKSVSAGDYFTCGLSTTGDGYCWGYGYYGQLGNGALNNSTVPVKVSGGLSFVDVQASLNTACGLTAAGQVYCWGGSYISTPAAQSNRVFASMAIGSEGGSTRACALTPDNDLYCWYAAIF